MDEPTICIHDTIISLAKLSAIRWDTMCFLLGGAMKKGISQGTLSEECFAEAEKAEEIIFDVLGKDPSILEPGYYSKLLMSPMQRGWKWNEQKMDWSTDEDFIDTSKPINHKLLKYNCHELIRNMPEQFRRFCMIDMDDCKMLSAICDNPAKAMAIHNKLDTVNNWGHKKSQRDEKSTPFYIYQLTECKNNLLLHAKDTDNEVRKEEILKQKLEHYNRCMPCFKSFRKRIFSMKTLHN